MGWTRTHNGIQNAYVFVDFVDLFDLLNFQDYLTSVLYDYIIGNINQPHSLFPIPYSLRGVPYSLRGELLAVARLREVQRERGLPVAA